ncbi:ATP phosphoribosyltransferase regulatory subunit [Candidatus Falkowbacteria bacterium]|nr:ATP phosphoribosyltransferase regulatory subunit [Candidatus Falkowbacteria bacterium]
MPRRKKSELEIKQVKQIKTPALIAGVKDALPTEDKFWMGLLKNIFEIAQDYTFQYIDTPIMERPELFGHTFGRGNKLVPHGIATFLQKNEKFILRPDTIPALARAFIEHNLGNQSSILKLFSFGKIFRGIEDEHVGNLRQANELTLEVFGNKAGATEAELIFIFYNLFKRINAESVVILNSCGCLNCIENYEKALQMYYRPKKVGLCVKCKNNLGRRIFDVLKCENTRCQKIREDAPQIVDWLCQECKDHYFKVVEALDDLQVPYQLNPWLIKDFEYQNRTIFEMRFNEGGSNKSLLLAKGSRHDNLVQMLGGDSVPAVGISLVAEKIIRLMRENKIVAPERPGTDVYLAQLAETAKRKAMVFFEDLRKEGYAVKANFTRNSLKSQLEHAKKVDAKLILILAHKEIMENTIILRDAESGAQEVVNFDKVKIDIKKKLHEINARRSKSRS